MLLWPIQDIFWQPARRLVPRIATLYLQYHGSDKHHCCKSLRLGLLRNFCIYWSSYSGGVKPDKDIYKGTSLLGRYRPISRSSARMPSAGGWHRLVLCLFWAATRLKTNRVFSLSATRLSLLPSIANQSPLAPSPPHISLHFCSLDRAINYGLLAIHVVLKSFGNRERHVRHPGFDSLSCILVR